MRLVLAAALPAFAAALPQAPQTSFAGQFELTAVSLNGPATLRPRSFCGSDRTLLLTLSNGVVTDGLGRTGYIASNSQLQFDNPPQSNALHTSGFSISPNSSLALDGSAVWYQCLSGTFFNLYAHNTAVQCSPILFDVIPCDGKYQFPEPATVGYTQVATVVETVVSGSITTTIQTTVPIPLCQIPDGQVQAHLTPCAEIQLPILTISLPSPPPPPSSPISQPISTTPAPSPSPAPVPVPAPIPVVSTSLASPVISVTPPTSATTLPVPSPVTPETTTTLPFSVTTTSQPAAPTAGAVTYVPGSLFALAMGVAVTLLCI